MSIEQRIAEFQRKHLWSRKLRMSDSQFTGLNSNSTSPSTP
jgi:hypothetical protein